MQLQTLNPGTEHEQVVECIDRNNGYHGIIAIHNTALGPAVGGTRVWPYLSASEALQDVLRLSRSMTYKCAIAGLQLGGGKAVIIASGVYAEGSFGKDLDVFGIARQGCAGEFLGDLVSAMPQGDAGSGDTLRALRIEGIRGAGHFR